jgi:hypothetical protein
MRRGFTPGFVNYKKRCTRLAVASDKVYQLLAHGRWFSLGTPSFFQFCTEAYSKAGSINNLIHCILKYTKGWSLFRLPHLRLFHMTMTKDSSIVTEKNALKFTSCLPMVDGSLWVLPASSTTKTGRHDIAEILLKVALNTINQIKFLCSLSHPGPL